MVSWSRSDLQIIAISSSKGSEELCHLLFRRLFLPLVRRKLGISSLQIFAADKYKKLSFSENRYLQGSSHAFYQLGMIKETTKSKQTTDIYRDLHILSTYWT
jgi:hypothetical protein